jgi:hypothetical protein
MEADMAEIKIECRLAWWFRFYTFGLYTMIIITGLEPDWQKVDLVIRRAIRMRVR